MRTLNKRERSMISGGMVPPPPGGPGDPGDPGGGGGTGGGGSGGGGGTGQGWTPYGPQNPLLGMQSLEDLAQDVGLVDIINTLNITVVEQQDPNASLGSASANMATDEIYVPSSVASSLSARSLTEILAHEVGHIEHPYDNDPGDYGAGATYVSTALTGEGWAQIQAIDTSEAISDEGQGTVSIPASSQAEADAEVGLYYSDKAAGYTDAQSAADLGSFLAGETLTAGETNEEFWSYGYQAYWDEQQGIPVPPPPPGVNSPYNFPYDD